MSNIEDQVADIRERVAGIEARLCYLQRAIDQHVKSVKAETAKGNGNVIIPITVVIAGLEVIKIIAERML